MNKLLVSLGVILAAAGALVFLGAREAAQRPGIVPAKKAADMLAEAWSDHRTRA